MLIARSLRFHDDWSWTEDAVSVVAAEAAAWTELSAAWAADRAAMGKATTSPTMRLNLYVMFEGPPHVETVSSWMIVHPRRGATGDQKRRLGTDGAI
jgi:hypothetical protein